MIGETFSIAVSGKGGVGKTNISAMLIRHLCEKGTVLAIDADPDSNLPQALGIMVSKTVGDIRESAVKKVAQNNLSGNEMQVFGQDLKELVEGTDRFDLVVMGRPEGEGCYCGINHIIRQMIDTRAEEYDFTVIDCEAGLEHLSRRTTNNISLLIVVTDPSYYGLMAAKSIEEMRRDLLINFGQTLLVANKVRDNIKDHIDKIAIENGLKIDAYIPYSTEIASLDATGGSVFELPLQSEAFIAVERLCKYIYDVKHNGA